MTTANKRSIRSLEERLGIARVEKRSLVMGILNVTPDSFSDGNRFFGPDNAVMHGIEMAADGADILDIGGESTRPGAEPVGLEEEMNRVIPVIRALRDKTDALISVDTYKAAVAEKALDSGADIVNDISGMNFDPGMAKLVARRGIPVIIMHIKGEPRSMQQNPHYKDVVGEVADYFRERIGYARSQGIKDSQIILDPGIGFGKNREHNLALIRAAHTFAELGFPVLYGISRKAFIGDILGLPVGERVEGTIAACLYLAAKNVSVLRVHDVKNVTRALKVYETINNFK